MRGPIESFTDADFREAHVVLAVDEGVPEFNEPIVGGDFAPPVVPKGAPAFEIIEHEIEINSSDPAALVSARQRVMAARSTA